jgi:hypothetical protein
MIPLANAAVALSAAAGIMQTTGAKRRRRLTSKQSANADSVLDSQLTHTARMNDVGTKRFVALHESQAERSSTICITAGTRTARQMQQQSHGSTLRPDLLLPYVLCALLLGGCRYKYGLYWDTVSSGAALLLSRKLQDKAYSDQLANMLDVSCCRCCFCVDSI